MKRAGRTAETQVGESPVIGSQADVARLLDESAEGPVPQDEAGKHLLRLVRLHPELKIDLRADRLGELTDKEKRTMISDIQDLLQIAPLRQP